MDGLTYNETKVSQHFSFDLPTPLLSHRELNSLPTPITPNYL